MSMQGISEIDKNFIVESQIKKEDLKFYDVESAPFKLYGLQRENDRFCRLPGEVAKTVNGGVFKMHTKTAGGRVRFVTDSSYVAISAQLDAILRSSQFAFTGCAGFDLYQDEGKGQIYQGTFIPPLSLDKGYESVIDFPDRRKRVITIHFPILSDVKKLYIGLQEGALLLEAPDYRYEKPIVYYGSSITQGECASRPGNSYQAIISRALDCDFLNLGFSGNAKGEDSITEYISRLDMQCFVMDYDYNAPTLEHYEATHERMYCRIRQAQPELPIVILTRPKVHLTDVEEQRVEIAQRTYQNAVKNGDKNVYFIKGSELIAPEVMESATVDGVHPNDSGFVSMACALSKLLRNILQ